MRSCHILILNGLGCLSPNVFSSYTDFLISAAVAEFKGPGMFGVVRLAQVNMELARIEASFSGLSPGKHGWSINEYGDLIRGAASTGNVFNPTKEGPTNEVSSNNLVSGFYCCHSYCYESLLYKPCKTDKSFSGVGQKMSQSHTQKLYITLIHSYIT